MIQANITYFHNFSSKIHFYLNELIYFYGT